ncbi:MAG: aldo/keto reductase [Oscillospiraceae bacterium]|nr:aldo/keto reductase [Oscillospiraceae bacterium]
MNNIKIGGVLNASAVAMGCMRLTNVQGDIDRVIGTALDEGINFFDHADIYGGGRCEALFGEYLSSHRDIRDKIIIQTKCSIRPGRYDFSKSHILSSVEGSLKRLKTDSVDILLLHRPDALMEPEEVAEAFNELQSSGKVRYFGVSNHNPLQIELLKTAVTQPLIVNQMQLSLTEAGMITSGLNVNLKNSESVMHDGSVLDYMRLKGMTLQAWSPFQQGFIKSPFVGDYENFPKLNEKLDELAKKYGVESVSVAGAWILRHPAKIQLISGSMNPERIRAICAGADITLSREDWYELYLAAGYRLP